MAIGAHELLLIVRAQNQASALLGRVGRDVRRLQSLRDINLQRAAAANRLARNQIQQTGQLARMESVLAADGKIRLQHQQAIARNALQQFNVESRITNLDVRRTGLVRAAAGIEVQRLRLLRQELTVESNLEKIELRRQTINNQIGRIGTQILRNGVQQQQLTRQAYSLETQLIERQQRALKARRTVDRLQRAGVSGAPLRDAQIAQTIANRRVRETAMAQGEIPGQRGVLQAVSADFTNNIRAAESQLVMLGTEERKVAQDAAILAERHKVLAAQLSNVDARTVALDSAEGQLIRELAILENELGIINARWEEHKAALASAGQSIGVLRNEEELLNKQLAEQNALLARQNLERLRTGAQAIGHVGRVTQVAGLIGTAAFGAMAISAAHFNTEATRAATQVGSVGSNSRQVVANASRIEKAIIGIMHAVPANQQDLTDALYNIYSSMNTTFGNGTKLLKLFGQVWVAGGMQGNVNDVADALITLGNNWNINAGDMQEWRKVAASTLATVRFGRLTVDQYTQTMNQLAPAFHGAGQSIEQMNGALAFLTRLLPSQRVTAAGIARMMELIQRFAAHPASGFEKLARDIQDANGNLKPLNQVLEIFISRFPKLRTSGVFLTNFFKLISNQQGTIQARRALQGFVKQFQLYEQVLKNTRSDNREFNRSLKAMQQAGGVKWAQFVNDMRAFGLELGSTVLPGLLKVADVLQSGVRWFDSLSSSTKTTIGHILAFVAVGSLLLGTLAAIVGSAAAMIISFKILRGEATSISAIFGLSTTKSAGLASEVGSANTKFGILAGSLTAVSVLLIKYPHMIGDIVNALGGLKGVLIALTTISVIRTLTRLQTSVGLIGAEALTASGRVATLRNKLLTLASIVIPAIVIPISIKAADDLATAPKPGTPVAKFHKGILGTVQKIGAGLEYYTDYGLGRLTGKSRSDAARRARAATIGDVGTQLYNGPQSALDDLVKIDKNPLVPNSMKVAAHAAFSQGKYNVVSKMARQSARLKTATNIKPFRISPGRVAKETYSTGYTEPYMAALRSVARLQQEYGKASNMKNYIAYTKALNALNARSTKLQQGYTQDYLGRVTTADKQTVADAKKAARDRAKISKSQFFDELKNVITLRNAYLKSHSQADQQKFFEARKQLMKDSSDSERKYLSDSITRTDAAYKKQLASQKAAIDTQNKTYADALSNLAGMYNQFYSEQQQNFGNLFQGPVLSGAGFQALSQWGVTGGPKDILKDLKAQEFQYRKFNTLVGRLQKRGAPRELIDQVRAAGPGAMTDIQAIANMTPKQWRQYVKVFKKGQQDIKNATMAQLKSQVSMYRTHGQNIAKAIVAGITSEDTKLQSALERLLEKQFGLKPAPGYKKPSHKGNIINDNRTTIHVSGHPGDHKTKAAIRHSVWQTRVHASGRF